MGNNSFSTETSRSIDSIKQWREITLDKANFPLFIALPPHVEPTTFDEVRNHPNQKIVGYGKLYSI
jgi:hypothetical protein